MSTASAANLAANRANAAHSTGPANTSRTRFNGVAHGLTSRQTVIRGEDQQEFDTFSATLRRQLAPGSPVEDVLADRIIAAAWRLKRFTRVEAAFFNDRIDTFLEENPGSGPDCALAILFTVPAEMARMRLFLRYQTSLQREYDSCMRQLQKLQSERAHDDKERACIDEIMARSATREASGTCELPVRTAASALAVGFASQSAAARVQTDLLSSGKNRIE